MNMSPIKIALWVPIGAIVSYYFNQIFGLGPVMGAALTGTLASFIPNINRDSDYLPQLSLPPSIVVLLSACRVHRLPMGFSLYPNRECFYRHLSGHFKKPAEWSGRQNWAHWLFWVFR
jgi:hypothetical protein